MKRWQLSLYSMSPFNDNEPIEIIPIPERKDAVIIVRPWPNEVRMVKVEDVGMFPKNVLIEWMRRVNPVVWCFDSGKKHVIDSIKKKFQNETIRLPLFLIGVIPDQNMEKRPTTSERFIVSFHPLHEKDVYCEYHSTEDFLHLYGHEYLVDNYIQCFWICAKEVASKKLKTIIGVLARKGYVVVMNSGRKSFYLFEVENVKNVKPGVPVFCLSNIKYHRDPHKVPPPEDGWPYYILDANIVEKYIKGITKNRGNISLKQ